MDNIIIYLLFLVGIILIVKGGDWFVDGAAWIAAVTGIPQFIIGATIVSLATTLPEIMVSALAAIEGHQILTSGVGNYLIESQEKVGMAIGNGIGSVICNTALIMALSMIFLPISVKRKDFLPKGSLLILAIAALFVLSLNGSLTIAGAVVLLVIFAAFIAENVISAKANPSSEEEKIQTDSKSVIKHLALILVGIVCIVLGSDILVDYGSEIARNLGVSEAIIGVTMIAIGTSLPELVTAVTAILKKQASMSVGNVIGANVIDTTLILAIGSFIYGGNLPVSAQNLYLDFPVALLVAILAIVPTAVAKKFQKWQGILLILLYLAYLVIVSTRLDWYLSLFSVSAL